MEFYNDNNRPPLSPTTTATVMMTPSTASYDDNDGGTDEAMMMIPDDEYYMQQPAVKVFFFCCYAFIFVVGVVSNGIMLTVGLRKWAADNRAPKIGRGQYRMNAANNTAAVTNLLVVNLAAGDIVLCIFSAPSTPFSYYFPHWPLGEFACRFLPSTLIMAVCVISFTSTVLAVDRHLAICYPSERRLTVRWAVLAIVLIWLGSILCSVPIFIFRELIETSDENDEPILHCQESWSPSWQKIYSIFSLAISFAVPFLIIAYCYSTIFLVIRTQATFRSRIAAQPSFAPLAVALSNTLRRKSNVKVPSDGSSSPMRLRSERPSLTGATTEGCFGGCVFVSLIFDARFVRTTRILVLMISVFMTCWFPINLLQVLQDYFIDAQLWTTTRWYSLAWFLTHVVAMSSTLWNPLLYGWMNEHFRSELTRVFSLKRKRVIDNSSAPDANNKASNRPKFPTDLTLARTALRHSDDDDDGDDANNMKTRFTVLTMLDGEGRHSSIVITNKYPTTTERIIISREARLLSTVSSPTADAEQEALNEQVTISDDGYNSSSNHLELNNDNNNNDSNNSNNNNNPNMGPIDSDTCANADNGITKLESDS